MLKRHFCPTGKRFGRLVLGELDHRTKTNFFYNATCDCGATKIVSWLAIRKGKTKSCGCLAKESKPGLKHGQATRERRTREFNIWNNMVDRCRRETNPSYPDYGGRGISVCERWADFKNFFVDMGPAPSPKHSIDRIDVNGNYEPSNCRWATNSEQARNRRNNTIMTVAGETAPQVYFIEKYGIPRETIRSRLKCGWTDDEAFEVVPRASRRAKTRFNT